MKRWIFCTAMAVLAWVAMAPSAWARGGVRAEVVIGPIGPWAYYPAPVYYPPAYVVVPPVPREAPPVYIQQPSAPTSPAASMPAATPPQSYYFCPDSKTYYPYVQSCASGWQTVAPRPEGVAPR